MKNIAKICMLLVLISATSCSSQKKIENDQKKQSTTVETKKESMTQILIQTSMGDIKIALYNETPQHRDNFIKLEVGS